MMVYWDSDQGFIPEPFFVHPSLPDQGWHETGSVLPCKLIIYPSSLDDHAFFYQSESRRGILAYIKARYLVLTARRHALEKRHRRFCARGSSHRRTQMINPIWQGIRVLSSKFVTCCINDRLWQAHSVCDSHFWDHFILSALVTASWVSITIEEGRQALIVA